MQSEMNTFFYELQKYELNDENIQLSENNNSIDEDIDEKYDEFAKIDFKTKTVLS